MLYDTESSIVWQKLHTFLFLFTQRKQEKTPSPVIREVCVCLCVYLWVCGACMHWHRLSLSLFDSSFCHLLICYMCACRNRLIQEHAHLACSSIFFFYVSGYRVSKNTDAPPHSHHTLETVSQLFVNEINDSTFCPVLLALCCFGFGPISATRRCCDEKLFDDPFPRPTSYCSKVSLWMIGG